jgi:hypothetical protein
VPVVAMQDTVPVLMLNVFDHKIEEVVLKQVIKSIPLSFVGLELGLLLAVC